LVNEEIIIKFKNIFKIFKKKKKKKIIILLN